MLAERCSSFTGQKMQYNDGEKKQTSPHQVCVNITEAPKEPRTIYYKKIEN